MTGGNNRAKLQRKLLIGLCVLSLTGGCKVLTLKQDRALREESGTAFDAGRYVAEIWTQRAVPTIETKAVPLPRLLDAIGADIEAAGKHHGRQASESGPWTFVATGDAVVDSVDSSSREGTASLTVQDPSKPRSVRLQIGPVFSGTVIRDALPFITFNDFPDQISYADVGRALTARAAHRFGPVVATLKPGMHVHFTGVFNLRKANDPVVLTPVTLAATPGVP